MKFKQILAAGLLLATAAVPISGWGQVKATVKAKYEKIPGSNDTKSEPCKRDQGSAAYLRCIARRTIAAMDAFEAKMDELHAKMTSSRTILPVGDFKPIGNPIIEGEGAEDEEEGACEAAQRRFAEALGDYGEYCSPQYEDLAWVFLETVVKSCGSIAGCGASVRLGFQRDFCEGARFARPDHELELRFVRQCVR